MNGQDWTTLNAQYLSSAMDWLRLRLMRLGQTPSAQSAVKAASAPTPIAVAPTAAVAFTDRLLGRAARPVSPEAAAPEPLSLGADDPMGRAETQMKSLETGDSLPALIMLARQLGLSRFECEILLLCAAMEFDTRIPALCAHGAGRSAATLSDVCAGAGACSMIQPGRRCRPIGRCATGA